MADTNSDIPARRPTSPDEVPGPPAKRRRRTKIEMEAFRAEQLKMQMEKEAKKKLEAAEKEAKKKKKKEQARQQRETAIKKKAEKREAAAKKNAEEREEAFAMAEPSAAVHNNTCIELSQEDTAVDDKGVRILDGIDPDTAVSKILERQKVAKAIKDATSGQFGAASLEEQLLENKMVAKGYTPLTLLNYDFEGATGEEAVEASRYNGEYPRSRFATPKKAAVVDTHKTPKLTKRQLSCQSATRDEISANPVGTQLTYKTPKCTGKQAASSLVETVLEKISENQENILNIQREQAATNFKKTRERILKERSQHRREQNRLQSLRLKQASNRIYKVDLIPSPMPNSAPSLPSRKTISLWDRLPVELQSSILSASDPLTQHLNDFHSGPYSPSNLRKLKSADHYRPTKVLWEGLCNDIWIAALKMKWEGDGRLLPGKLELGNWDWLSLRQQIDWREWYTLVDTKEKLEWMGRNAVGYWTIWRNIAMRHVWLDVLEDIGYKKDAFISAADGGHLEYLLHLEREHTDPFFKSHWESLAIKVASEGQLQHIQFLHQSRPWCFTKSKTIIGAAALSGNLELVQYLTTVFHDEITMSTSSLTHAFEKACAQGHLEIIKFLHEQISNTTFQEGEYSMDVSGALKAASSAGHLEVIKYLHSQGANQTCTCKNTLGSAASNGHLPIVRFLLENHQFDKSDARGFTEAAQNGYLEIVKLLYQYGLVDT
ncbi:hypothetical protein HDV05_006243, partial [Chytridiales sp. JEL 0842]